MKKQKTFDFTNTLPVESESVVDVPVIKPIRGLSPNSSPKLLKYFEFQIAEYIYLYRQKHSSKAKTSMWS